jgi:hypothetical protein
MGKDGQSDSSTLFASVGEVADRHGRVARATHFETRTNAGA